MTIGEHGSGEGQAAERPVWRPVVFVLLAFVGVAGGAAWWWWPQRPAGGVVDIATTGPVYETVEALSAASDVVVVGVFDGEGPGRVMSSAVDPGARVGTTLFTFAVESVLVGSAGSELIVEHVTTLGDGVSVTLDGVPAPEVGGRYVLFLVENPDESVPYFAIINAQGRYRLVGDTLLADADDVVSSAFAEVSLPEIRRRFALMYP